MTDRMAEIEGRLAKATPGEWVCKHGKAQSPKYRSAYVMTENGDLSGNIAFMDGMRGQRWEDGDMIANAPSDLRYLLDRVKALEDFYEKFESCNPNLLRDKDLKGGA